MPKNFREKPFYEKVTIILTAISLAIGIFVGIKSFVSEEKKDEPKIYNSGDNSNIISGNGNTINSNNYIIKNDNSIDKNKETYKKALERKSENSQLKNIQVNDGKIKIAILPFENITNDKEYEWLSKGIAESLLVNLSISNKFTVVEGTLRDKVLDEINFQQGKYVDINSAVKIGKMLGSNEILIGSYQIIHEKIKITSRIIDVESGKIIKNSTIDYEDSISDLFKMQKNFSNYYIDKVNY